MHAGKVCSSLILIGTFICLLVQHEYYQASKKGDTKEQQYFLLFDVPHQPFIKENRSMVLNEYYVKKEIVIAPISLKFVGAFDARGSPFS